VLNACADGGLCTDDSHNMAMMKDLAPDAKQCKPGEETKLKSAKPAVVTEAAVTQTPISQSSGAHKS